jgi:hypothetical protein
MFIGPNSPDTDGVRRRIATLLKKSFPLRRRAWFFQTVVPKRFWFQGMLLLTRCLAAIARLAGLRECARYEASTLDGWLAELTHWGAFPVKYHVDGAHHLVRDSGDKSGILYCTVHVPLAGVMMRGLMELGAPPDCLLAAPHNINENGEWLPTGKESGFKALPPGPSLLRQVRTLLAEGGIFASMLDADIGGPLRPTLLRLAGSVRARVIFCWAAMDGTRNIVVTYRTAPHPVPDTEEKVRENLAALDAEREKIFAGLRGQYWGREA